MSLSGLLPDSDPQKQVHQRTPISIPAINNGRPSNMRPLTRQSVLDAHEIIKPLIHRTPVVTSTLLNQLASTSRKKAKPVLRLWFKCENQQRIGAFKVRGAFHAIEKLKQEPGWIEGGGLSRGVVGFSAGTTFHFFFFCFYLSYMYGVF